MNDLVSIRWGNGEIVNIGSGLFSRYVRIDFINRQVHVSQDDNKWIITWPLPEPTEDDEDYEDDE